MSTLAAMKAADVAYRGFNPARDYEAAAELISATNLRDGVDWLPTATQLRHEWGTIAGFAPDRDALVAERDGQLAGLVNVEWRARADKVTHVVELWVAQAMRRRGIGTDLLAWAEARARASVAEGNGGPPELQHVIDGYADTAVPGHAELAAARGYHVERHFFTMVRPLDAPIPGLPLPAGVEIRPVRPEDHRAIWEADVDAFRDHWEASVRTDQDFEGVFTHPDLDTGLWLVAWDGDEVAGSVQNWIIREENERLGIQRGWLEHVSVRRPWRRLGLASALIARSLLVLRERGMTEGALGVDAANPTGALRLYEALGFRVLRTARLYRRPLDDDSPEARSGG
jgi:mycothiol synthase